MAWSPPGRGELRDRVRFERRIPQGNVAGIVRGRWAVVLGDRRVKLSPLTGGEDVQQARATGTDTWTLELPADTAVRLLTTGDRVVDARDPRRMFDIRSILDLQAGRDRWRVMTLTRGEGDGR